MTCGPWGEDVKTFFLAVVTILSWACPAVSHKFCANSALTLRRKLCAVHTIYVHDQQTIRGIMAVQQVAQGLPRTRRTSLLGSPSR